MAKKGRKPKERKGYFYEKEEQAVVDYINSTDEEERNRLFNTIILPALTKMIESLIRRYKLFVPEEEFQQTFNDTISYLLTKISNYKQESWGYYEFYGEPTQTPIDLSECSFHELLKEEINENSPKYIRVISDNPWTSDIIEGEEPLFKIYKLELRHFKAYSYCGTVCKNYLIYKNIQYTKNKQRNLSYDDMFDDFYHDPKYVTKTNEESVSAAEQMIKKISGGIKEILDDPSGNTLTDNEIKVGTALVDLLDNWEEILDIDGSNKLRKSSVLYFLREETMMSTKEVRENMRKYKSAYYLLKKGLLDEE